MLWFIGIGIEGIKGTSLSALEALENCNFIYYEKYTSLFPESELHVLEQILKERSKKSESKAVDQSFLSAKRWFIEDGRVILEKAKNNDVAILTYGDPFIATTHTELRVRAIKHGIKVNVIHSSSGLSALIGESGLHSYKFGRTVTMMSEPQSLTSVYNTIHDNLLMKCHTLILTEYRSNEDYYEKLRVENAFFLNPSLALEKLLDYEKDAKQNLIKNETFAIVASRIGSAQQKVVSGTLKSLIAYEFGQGPHSIIITGSMHFTEEESILNLSENLDPVNDNSRDIKRPSAMMVEKYAPGAKHALRQLREIVINQEGSQEDKKGVMEVLDNAEYYIDDAERFLSQNKPDLAVLSIGYAEGLIDALRFQKGINPW